MARRLLHRADAPASLALLDQVCSSRPAGWEPTEVGAVVDWDALASSHLSTTERAVVQIARGVAALEEHGGGAGRLSRAVHDAVEAVL